MALAAAEEAEESSLGSAADIRGSPWVAVRDLGSMAGSGSQNMADSPEALRKYPGDAATWYADSVLRDTAHLATSAALTGFASS